MRLVPRTNAGELFRGNNQIKIPPDPVFDGEVFDGDRRNAERWTDK